MGEYHNVPVKRATWLRLRDYKMVSATYDAVLNELMDSVPLEMLTDKVLAEHKDRIATFDGRDWREIRADLREEPKDVVLPRARGPSRRKGATRSTRSRARPLL